MADMAVQSDADGSRRTLRARQGAQRASSSATTSSTGSDPRRRDLRAGDARRHHSRRCLPARWPALQAIRLRFPMDAALDTSVDRQVRRAGADLRHAGDLVDRHADRGAGRPRIAMFLTELCPHGCGARSASPSNCSPAFPASSTASGACSCWRRSWPIRPARSDRRPSTTSRCCRIAVRRAALRHRHVHRRR